MRKKATGRYETRQQLLDAVWILRGVPQLGVREISNIVRVSPPTVSRIYRTGERKA